MRTKCSIIQQEKQMESCAKNNMSSPFQYHTLVHKSIFGLQQEQNLGYIGDNYENLRIHKKIVSSETENEEIVQRHLFIENSNNNNNINNNTNNNNNINNGNKKDEQKNKSYHYTQVIAALAVSLGPFSAGLGKGFSSPAIYNMQEEVQLRHIKGNYTSFPVSDQEASWIASLSLLGALFGGLSGGFVIQFGRKRILALVALPYSLAWIITVFATSIETMFLTAFAAGYCCSLVSIVTQVYVSEIASSEIRGCLSAIQKISSHLGVLISFLMGAYLDWRQLAMMISIAPMMLFVTVIYIPETPSYLIFKGKNYDAFNSLQWLRGPGSNIEKELETIKCNVQKNNYPNKNMENIPAMEGSNTLVNSIKKIYGKTKALFKDEKFSKPLFVTCSLQVFQRFTGANSFGFYAVKIFRQTFSGMNPHGGAIAVAFVQLLASLLSGLLIDIVGRIPLLIASSVLMSLALASFGSYVYYEQITRASVYNMDSEIFVNYDWIPLLCVLVFTIAFSLGISPISSLLIGELFSLEYRGLGSSISTSFGYFCAFLGVKTFIDFQEFCGLHGAFWLYACISCVGLLFIVLYVPETKGKDLDEMEIRWMGTYVLNR